MKKEYIAPEVELISLTAKETVTSEVPDGSWGYESNDDL